MSRGIFDDDFDPADAIDAADLDRYADPDPDLDDPLLDEDDIAILKDRRRVAPASGGRRATQLTKRKKP